MRSVSDPKIAFDVVVQRRSLPQPDAVGFGSHASDHMFVAEHTNDQGWHDLRIMPYGPLELEPRTLALHYGQTIFEGLKVFRQPGGDVALFRPYENARRLIRSAARMSMPALPEEIFVSAASALADIDRNWILATEGSTLYLRPLMIAVDPFLGVQSSNRHRFVIMACPVAPVFDAGSVGIRLLAREDIARTASGGIGDAKTAANYGPTVAALEDARSQGYDNLLWLDAAQHRWIEEAGITNVFVRYERKVITPPLSERILAGITRDTVITMLGDRGFDVHQTDIDIGTLTNDIDQGLVREIFVTGTATVIAPVAELGFRGRDYRLRGDESLARSLRSDLLDLQNGHAADPHHWRHAVHAHG